MEKDQKPLQDQARKKKLVGILTTASVVVAFFLSGQLSLPVLAQVVDLEEQVRDIKTTGVFIEVDPQEATQKCEADASFPFSSLATRSITMADGLGWEGNSRAMFDKTLERNPFFIRPLVRRKLLAALKEQSGSTEDIVVTEEAMYNAVKKIAPASRLEQALETLDALKTKGEDS